MAWGYRSVPGATREGWGHCPGPLPVQRSHKTAHKAQSGGRAAGRRWAPHTKLHSEVCSCLGAHLSRTCMAHLCWSLVSASAHGWHPRRT